jgi:hypothetical protein
MSSSSMTRRPFEEVAVADDARHCFLPWDRQLVFRFEMLPTYRELLYQS